MVKSEIEQRVEALEGRVGNTRMLERMAATETKSQVVNNTSGLNDRVTELELRLQSYATRVEQLETQVFNAAGAGQTEQRREADPALNPVVLPVVDRAATLANATQAAD